jgi:hypothetical protein
MRSPDLERERSERPLTPAAFLEAYNENLPASFPRATPESMDAYRKAYPALFKGKKWSLDQHRKKYMDWLPQYLKLLAQQAV